jgi:hypothetical protein
MLRRHPINAVPFDTLKLVDRLQSGGFTAEQSLTFATALVDAAGAADLVAKPHLDNRLLVLEQRLIIRFGGTLVIAVGILLAAIGYLPAH